MVHIASHHHAAVAKDRVLLKNVVVVSPSIAQNPSIAKNHIKNGVESKNLGFEIKMSLIIIIIN